MHADLDQTAPLVSTLYAQACLSENLISLQYFHLLIFFFFLHFYSGLKTFFLKSVMAHLNIWVYAKKRFWQTDRQWIKYASLLLKFSYWTDIRNEPPHDKTNEMACVPSEDSCVPSEDSDQPGQMPRLIRVFPGRTVILLVLSWGGSNIDND